MTCFLVLEVEFDSNNNVRNQLIRFTTDSINGFSFLEKNIRDLSIGIDSVLSTIITYAKTVTRKGADDRKFLEEYILDSWKPYAKTKSPPVNQHVGMGSSSSVLSVTKVKSKFIIHDKLPYVFDMKRTEFESLVNRSKKFKYDPLTFDWLNGFMYSSTKDYERYD